MKDKIVIPIVPIPASRPRVTRFATFYTKSYTKYREFLHPYIKNLGLKKINGAVSISIVFYMPIPKSWNNILRDLYGRGVENNLKSIRKNQLEIFEDKYAPTGADVDNLAKALFDALNKVAFEDDSQIISTTIVKKYSSNPRTEFSLMEVK